MSAIEWLQTMGDWIESGVVAIEEALELDEKTSKVARDVIFPTPATFHPADMVEKGRKMGEGVISLASSVGEVVPGDATVKIVPVSVTIQGLNFVVRVLHIQSKGSDPMRCLRIGDPYDNIDVAPLHLAPIFSALHDKGNIEALEIMQISPHDIACDGEPWMPESYRDFALIIQEVISVSERIDSLYCTGKGARVLEFIEMPETLILDRPDLDNATKIDDKLCTNTKDVLLIYPHTTVQDKIFPKYLSKHSTDIREYMYANASTTCNVQPIEAEWCAEPEGLYPVIAHNLTKAMYVEQDPSLDGDARVV
jgi:hypothetical protein